MNVLENTFLYWIGYYMKYGQLCFRYHKLANVLKSALNTYVGFQVDTWSLWTWHCRYHEVTLKVQHFYRPLVRGNWTHIYALEHKLANILVSVLNTYIGFLVYILAIWTLTLQISRGYI